jgi:hypothetical protein
MSKEVKSLRKSKAWESVELSKGKKAKGKGADRSTGRKN